MNKNQKLKKIKINIIRLCNLRVYTIKINFNFKQLKSKESKEFVLKGYYNINDVLSI